MMFFLGSVRLNVLSAGIAPSRWDVVVEMKKILGVLEHIMIFFFWSHIATEQTEKVQIF